MVSEARRRFEAFLQSPSAKAILADYFRELLDERTRQLLSCNKDTFERQQGMAQELQSLLNQVSK